MSELGIIGENRIFDGIKVQNAQTSSGNITIQLIELNQYLKASLYNEVGINANFNMKRERLNSNEVDMNVDVLHPLIDNMLLNRQKGIEKLNMLYGLDAFVEFGSIWKIRKLKDKVSVEDEILNLSNKMTEATEEVTEEVTETNEEVVEVEEVEEATEENK